MNKVLQLSIFLSFVLTGTFLSAQGTIRGTIQNESGVPLEFASIFVKETGKGAIANVEGVYELRLNPGHYTLVFQYLGYATLVKEIDVARGIRQVDVVLKKQAYELQEVQVGVPSPF